MLSMTSRLENIKEYYYILVRLEFTHSIIKFDFMTRNMIVLRKAPFH